MNRVLGLIHRNWSPLCYACILMLGSADSFIAIGMIDRRWAVPIGILHTGLVGFKTGKRTPQISNLLTNLLGAPGKGETTV